MCALDMLVKRGYKATTIRDIAKELGISTGLFFNYFRTKEELYLSLIEYATHGANSIFSRIDGQEPITFFENICKMILNYFRLEPTGAKMFILMLQALNSDATPPKVKEFARKFDSVTPVIPIILRGQREGSIKQGNPVVLAMTFWGTIQGMAEQRAINPGLPFPDSSWIVDILRA